MLTSSTNPNTTTTDYSALYGGGTKDKAKPSDAAASQDRFLKLLVAQLNNQDPMNPMDNAQMTSQMAQINTVSGIQQVNESIKSMTTQFAAMQVLQGASMIGRDVLTEGNTLSVQDGVGRGALDLAGTADKVTVQVLTSGGQLLDTIELGAKDAGRHSFEWDASAYKGSSAPVFKVLATQGTTAISSTALNRNTIASVSSDTSGMKLSLKGAGSVAYDAIKAIL